MGINPAEDDEQVTKEEIQMMLMEGNAQGVIDTQENEFIQNIFDFHDITAEQVCTHRTDVIVLDTEDSLDEWKISFIRIATATIRSVRKPKKISSVSWIPKPISVWMNAPEKTF